jgi:hypothetical protein
MELILLYEGSERAEILESCTTTSEEISSQPRKVNLEVFYLYPKESASFSYSSPVFLKQGSAEP